MVKTRTLTKEQKIEAVLAFTAFSLWLGTFAGLTAFGGHYLHQHFENNTWKYIAVGGSMAIGSALLGCLWFIPYQLLYNRYCRINCCSLCGKPLNGEPDPHQACIDYEKCLADRQSP